MVQWYNGTIHGKKWGKDLAVCHFSTTFVCMKPAQIFHQYIWIINTLRAYRGLTLEELNQKWIVDGVADGNPLQPWQQQK